MSDEAGMVPEPVTGGDTVISARELSEVREPAPSVSVSVTVNALTDADLDLVPEHTEDPEHTRPADSLDEEPVRSALTLAPPIPVPPERSTRTGFDEPLYPPRPPAPKWIAPALLAGGVLLGIPLAMLLASAAFWALSSPEPEPTPVPTPWAMVSSRPVQTATPTPAAVAEPPEPEMPILEDTPAIVVRTPRPIVAARTPVSTPMPTPAPVDEPAFATTGTLRIDGSKACDVFVDRSKVPEQTPLERELPAGKHTIGFVHKASGLWLEESYEIFAGGTLRLFVDVDQATVRVR